MLTIIKTDEIKEASSFKVIDASGSTDVNLARYWDGTQWTDVWPTGPVTEDFYTVNAEGILLLTPEFKTAINNNTDYKSWTAGTALPSFSALTTVTSLHKIFENLQMTNINLSDWDFTNIIDLSEMFLGCNKLTNFTISNKNFNTEEINLAKMFSGCSQLLEINFDNCSNILPSSMNNFAYNTSLLEKVIIENIDLTSIVVEDLEILLEGSFSGAGAFIGFAKDNYNAGIFNTYSDKSVLAYFTYDQDLNQFYIIKPQFNNIGTIELVPEFRTAIEDNADYFTEKGRVWIAESPLPNPNEDGKLRTLSYLFFKILATKLDLSLWNFTSVETLTSLFEEATALNNIIVPDYIDNTLVTTANNIFKDCTSLTTVPIKLLNNAPIVNFSSAFDNCANLISIETTNLNLNNTEYLTNMFRYCKKLLTIDLSTLEANNILDMSEMFYECTELLTVSLPITTANEISLLRTFQNNSSLTTVILENFNPVNLNLAYTFSGCSVLSNISFSTLTSIISSMTYAFYGNTNLTFLDFTNINALGCNKEKAFTNCSNLTGGYAGTFTEADEYNLRSNTGLKSGSYFNYNGPLAKFYAMSAGTLSFNPAFKAVVDNETDYVVDNVTEWVAGAPLPNIPIDTKSTMNMFLDMDVMSNVDLSLWETPNLINTYGMFRGCHNLLSLDLSTFNLTQVTTMSYMFEGCNATTNIVLPATESSIVTDTSYMFQNCTALANIDTNVINFTNVTKADYMFNGCKSLPETFEISTFTSESITCNRMFFDVTGVKYFILKNFKGKLLASSVSYNLLFGRSNSIETLTLENVSFIGTTTNKGHNRLFADFDNLTHIYATNVVITDSLLDLLFALNPLLQYIEIEGFSFPNATSMQSLFRENTSITQTGFIGTPTFPSLLYFDGAFMENPNITDVSFLNTWNLPVVEDFSNIFNECLGLTQADFSIFNRPTLFNIDGAFRSCTNITEVINSQTELANVINMEYILAYTAITDVSFLLTLNAPKLETLSYAFRDCESLISVDLQFSTPLAALNDISNLFSGCGKLTSLHIKNISNVPINIMSLVSTTKVTSMTLDTLLLSSGAGSVSMTNNVPSTTAGLSLFGSTTITDITLKNISFSPGASCRGMFNRCEYLLSSNLTFENVNFDGVKDMSYMFASCLAFTEHIFPMFDATNITTFEGIYFNCRNITTINIPALNSGNNNSLRYTFARCASLVTLNAAWNTTEVRTMERCFENDVLLNFDFLNPWNLSAVENTSYMFVLSADNISRELILPTVFQTMPITNAKGMFSSEYSGDGYTNIDISNLNTTYLVDVSFMFAYNIFLASIAPPSNNGTGTITTCESMFTNNRALLNIDLTSFNVKNVTTFENTFYGCNSINNINFGLTETNSVIQNMSSTFRECSVLQDLDLSKFNTSNITTITNMFRDCGLSEVILLRETQQFNMPLVTSMSGVFGGTTITSSNVVSNMTLGAITDWSATFNNCDKLTSFDPTLLDETIVANTAGMFNGAGITDISFMSNKTFLRLTNMTNMFKTCFGLTNLTLENSTFPLLTSATTFASDCINLEEVHITNVEFTKATAITQFLNLNDKLKRVYINNFRTPLLYTLESWFRACPLLKTILMTGTINNLTRSAYLVYDSPLVRNISLTGFNYNVTNSSYKRYTFVTGQDIYRGLVNSTTSVTNINNSVSGVDTKYNFVALNTLEQFYYVDEGRLFLNPYFADALDRNVNFVVDNTTLWTVGDALPVYSETVTDLSYCFADLESLEILDLSLWNFDSITDVTNMFVNSTSLQTCYTNSETANALLNDRDITQLIETATFVVKP